MNRAPLVLSAIASLALTSACDTTQAGNSIKSVGNTVADTVGDAAHGAVSLVNVDLSNVLNNLALDLKIDKANIPINAQIPITIAANICGVSINILSVSTGGSPNCTAKSTSPQLEQAVQQQMAANGSVGGGAQTSAPASGATTSPAAGATVSGSTTTTGSTGTITTGAGTGATITAPTSTPAGTTAGTATTGANATISAPTTTATPR